MDELMREIVEEDPRYNVDAYIFLRESLDVTIKIMDKPLEGPARHVSGRELLEGIRTHAINEFGPIVRTVLAHWGITSTADFGEMVFNLVGKGILGKTDEDKRTDFHDVFDFEAAFVEPFLPARDLEADSPLPTPS